MCYNPRTLLAWLAEFRSSTLTPSRGENRLLAKFPLRHSFARRVPSFGSTRRAVYPSPEALSQTRLRGIASSGTSAALPLGALLILTLLLASPAHAIAPSVIGPTGLIRMPTADVLHHKDFNLALDYGFDFQDTSGGRLPQRGILRYKGNLGAMPGLELGLVGQTDKGTDRFKDGVFINMKYGLTSGEGAFPLRLAIGVENLTSSTEADVYLVASQRMKYGYSLHFGALFDFPQGKFRPLGMLGVTFPYFNGILEIVGEAFAGESLFQADAGIRVMMTPDVGLALHVLNITGSPSAKNIQGATLGLSWQNPF